MKKLYMTLLTVFLLVLFGFGLVSFFDKDATVSQVENRTLAAKPKFSFSALFDGSDDSGLASDARSARQRSAISSSTWSWVWAACSES